LTAKFSKKFGFPALIRLFYMQGGYICGVAKIYHEKTHNIEKMVYVYW